MEDIKYTVAVIKLNSSKFNKSNIDLIDKIDEFVTIIDTNHSGVVEVIAEHTGMTPEKIQGESTTCFQDDKYVYDLCFVDPSSNNIDFTDADINCISSHLTLQNMKVYNTCVLLKSRVNDEYQATPVEITIQDIKKLLKSKVYHTGILLSDKISEFNFYTDPLEDVLEEHVPDFGCIETPFLKFNLIAYFHLENHNDVINKNATRLLGKKIMGDVLIVSRSTEELYEDISKELYDRIDKLTWGRFSFRTLSDVEKEESDKKNGLPIIKNRFTLLNEREHQHTNKCVYCHKPGQIKNKIICTGCYRVSYDSEECRIEDWDEHKFECLYNKPTVNELVLAKTKENPGSDQPLLMKEE